MGGLRLQESSGSKSGKSTGCRESSQSRKPVIAKTLFRVRSPEYGVWLRVGRLGVAWLQRWGGGETRILPFTKRRSCQTHVARSWERRIALGHRLAGKKMLLNFLEMKRKERFRGQRESQGCQG